MLVDLACDAKDGKGSQIKILRPMIDNPLTMLLEI